jgi:hypothetical protein
MPLVILHHLLNVFIQLANKRGFKQKKRKKKKKKKRKKIKKHETDQNKLTRYTVQRLIVVNMAANIRVS